MLWLLLVHSPIVSRLKKPLSQIRISLIISSLASAQYDMIKEEYTGWVNVDNEPRVYFPINVESKSKTF